ncbi:hypothetical protein BGZ83_004787 [Gryganskiella cystojenkinii]|nr:hypothetical protein BGZ83_004787 [Gryganskiella cystojenkinii]
MDDKGLGFADKGEELFSGLEKLSVGVVMILSPWELAIVVDAVGIVAQDGVAGDDDSEEEVEEENVDDAGESAGGDRFVVEEGEEDCNREEEEEKSRSTDVLDNETTGVEKGVEMVKRGETAGLL